MIDFVALHDIKRFYRKGFALECVAMKKGNEMGLNNVN
jgi:hypothetical protein